jgi:NAD(P)H-hydrate epimerase
VKIVTVDEMRAIESAADAAGHSYAAMMELAGYAAAQALRQREDVARKRVLILVGPGNNGGDGLVAARHLAQAGANVACYLTRSRDPETDSNLRALRDQQVFCTTAEEDPDFEKLHKLSTGADVIIDALLGTGTQLPLRGTIARVVQMVGGVVGQRSQPSSPPLTPVTGIPEPAETQRPLIVAVDGPSGLEFDSGQIDQDALHADLTVTFAYPKRGHFRFPGAAALGDLVVADIGTDPALAGQVELEVMTIDMVREWLPARPPDAHKGTFGRALIVAGSSNYTGAARLAGAAATRAGAGLVTVALPAPIHAPIAAALPEATYLLLPNQLGVISEPAVEVLLDQTEGYDAMLVGPGLSQERETVAFVERLLGGTRGRSVGFSPTGMRRAKQPALPPLVIDADGLNILSQLEDWPDRLPPETVLTPHPGEMSRLMNAPIADIQADRVDVTRDRAAKWEQVIVLKGAYTVVAAPEGRTVLAPFANPGLATGGTGDVLAGIIIALRAQGLPPFESAAAGVYLHGLAGELARAEHQAAGMTAGDLVTSLPQAWQRLR